MSYTGKPNTVTNTHITKGDDLVIKIVDDYETFGHTSKRGNITMDIYYRSIPVAKQFLEKNITIFGLSKPNSKALPPAMKENKDRDEIS